MRMTGQVALIVACFPLNVVQFAAERQPGIDPEATSQVTPPLAYVRPVENVVVALLNFEKKAEVRPPKTLAEAVSNVTAPFAYVTPVPKVVVALGTHVPAVVYVRTFPAVPAAKSEEVEMEVASPVEPVRLPRMLFPDTCARLANGRRPVTSAVSETVAQVATPAPFTLRTN